MEWNPWGQTDSGARAKVQNSQVGLNLKQLLGKWGTEQRDRAKAAEEGGQLSRWSDSFWKMVRA